MIAIGLLFVRMLCDYFKSRPQLEAEIVILRHQLNLLQRRAPRRPHLRWIDRALFIWLYRRCPRVLRAITIVRPETVLRWHRMGFAAYWRWKSRSPGGRPRIAQEVRDLIRRMSLENPLWGATKIHGELLKLGIEVAQSTVSIYMVPRSDRPLQTWKTFLSNHTEGIASIDLFVVPTIAFQRLFAFLVLGHERRRLLWFAVTRNPTADWLARQITEAFPWDGAPKYLIRDNDRVFGAVFRARVRAMGIRDRPTSFRSPWQNGLVERFAATAEAAVPLLVLTMRHMRSGPWRTTWFLSWGNLDSCASQLLDMIAAVVLPIGLRSITRIEWNVSLYLTFFRPQKPGSGPTRSWLPLFGRGRCLRSPSHFPRGTCQPLLMPLSMTPLAVGGLLQMRLAPKCGQRISKRCVIPLASTRSARSIGRLRPSTMNMIWGIGTPGGA